MLGEDHSLAKEFPEHADTIAKRIASDARFAEDAKRYHALDKEIRMLELDGAPIDDDSMHQLKNERAVLKDTLYQRLLDSGSGSD